MNSLSEITNKLTQGAQANKTGNSLELFVQQALENNGYTLFTGTKSQLFNNRKKILVANNTPHKCQLAIVSTNAPANVTFWF
jgi:hypothetical protein